MNVIWITATFLSCSLVAAADIGNCFDIPFHRITPADSVTVSCPNTTGDEVKFILSMNKSKIRFVTWNVSRTEGMDGFLGQTENRSAQFVLSQLNISSTGFYTCDAERLYPPPYLSTAGVPRLVIVDEVPPVPGCQREEPPSKWIWVALAVVTVYSLIITGIAVGLRHNLKNTQNLQHDYMNMKSKALRKKQGVQHPVRSGRY